MYKRVAASLFFFGVSVLPAQRIVETVGSERPEAWAMRYFAAASLMQTNDPPSTLKKGQFALGFDVANIPRLSKSERTVGFNGTKEENLNKAPVIGRPLIHYGITDKLSVTAGYVPPVEIFDRLETHMAGLYFNYQLIETERWRLGLRAGGQWSEATGDFTCPADIAGIMDPEINPYNCIEPSSDIFSSKTGTIEGSVDYRLRNRFFTDLFVSAAYTYADLEFEVDALWAGGVEDQRLILTDGHFWSFAAGFRFSVTESISGTLALLHVPLDVRRAPDYETESSTLTHFRLSMHLLF